MEHSPPPNLSRVRGSGRERIHRPAGGRQVSQIVEKEDSGFVLLYALPCSSLFSTMKNMKGMKGGKKRVWVRRIVCHCEESHVWRDNEAISGAVHRPAGGRQVSQIVEKEDS
ncbi:MAG TPA: hypothetical protein PK636_01615 [bacterium]|nr:hypothetical protein [bacterium]HPJ71362.1 hypothetical protein [bacterium]HPQ66538.1 hypothetical protein [bacterium]